MRISKVLHDKLLLWRHILKVFGYATNLGKTTARYHMKVEC